MTSTQSPSKMPQITPIKESDFDEWERLFRLYIDFYKATLPDTQYRNTFDRLLDPTKDLYGLVLRDSEDESKLLGLAHFYPHQTPWSEKQVLHLNGTLTVIHALILGFDAESWHVSGVEPSNHY
jgi:hypothetical protein